MKKTELFLLQDKHANISLASDRIEPMDGFQAKHANNDSDSGIYGSIISKKSFDGYIVVKSTQGAPVTTTKVRADGRFFILLLPGSYELSAVSKGLTKNMQQIDIAIEKNVISKVTMQLESVQ